MDRVKTLSSRFGLGHDPGSKAPTSSSCQQSRSGQAAPSSSRSVQGSGRSTVGGSESMALVPASRTQAGSSSRAHGNAVSFAPSVASSVSGQLPSESFSRAGAIVDIISVAPSQSGTSSRQGGSLSRAPGTISSHHGGSSSRAPASSSSHHGGSSSRAPGTSSYLHGSSSRAPGTSSSSRAPGGGSSHHGTSSSRTAGASSSSRSPAAPVTGGRTMVPTSSSSASRTGAHNNKSPRYDPDPSRYGGSSSAYGVPPASSTASTFRQSSNAPNSSYTNGPSAVGSMFGVGALTSRSMTAGSSTRPNAYGAMTIAPAGPSSSRYAAPAPAPDPAAPAPQQSIHIHIHAQEPAAAPAPAPAPTPVPRVAQPREDAYHPRYGSRTRYVPVPVAVYDPFYDPFMHDRCLDPFCHYC